MSREVFRNFGRYLVEFFTMDRQMDFDVRLEGSDHLQEAKRPGRGAIVLTGHLGNWELGAAVIRRMGLPISVVALEHTDRQMNRLFHRQRQRCGIGVISLGEGAAQQSLAHLREGGILGLLGDQEFGANGIAATLFGQRVTLPRGPAMLSLRSRAPLVPSFLLRESPQRFRLVFEPPIWPAGVHGSASDPAQPLTCAYAAILERYLTHTPTQWLIFRPVN